MMSLAAWLLAWACGMGAEDVGQTVRFATFNIRELTAEKLAPVDDRGAGANPQLKNAAEVIQRVRPDVLLINEIDFDPATRRNAALFQDRYLNVSQNGQSPIAFPHIFFEPVNTGVPTGEDLDHDGRIGSPEDAFGFGRYPGQYGMALYSKYPIAADRARTFAKLLWKDVPGNLLPDGQDGKPAWYAPAQAAILRLSSKSHWDVPIRVGDVVVHVLCAHPTPPVFDGPEDRNGRRNFDEIRFWSDYLTGGEAAAYIVDDSGRRGPFPAAAPFVILGDHNADPAQAPADYGQPAIERLLRNPCVQDPQPAGEGAWAGRQPGPPQYLERRTADFGRIDYVLPSCGLRVERSGVFWPGLNNPLRYLVDGADASSDHRLVWVDVVVVAADVKKP